MAVVDVAVLPAVTAAAVPSPRITRRTCEDSPICAPNPAVTRAMNSASVRHCASRWLNDLDDRPMMRLVAEKKQERSDQAGVQGAAVNPLQRGDGDAHGVHRKVRPGTPAMVLIRSSSATPRSSFGKKSAPER